MMEWYGFAIGCALLAGLGAIIEKKALHRVHAMEFSAVLAIFNLLISLFLLPKVNFNIPATTYLLIFIASFVASIAFLLVAKSLRHADISLTSPILAFGPAITATLALFVLGETISAPQILGIMMIVMGSFVLRMDFAKMRLKNIFHSKYIQYIVFALFLYGISSLIDRFVLDVNSPANVNPETYLFLAHTFIAINFFFMLTVMYDGIKDVRKCIRIRWKWILAVAVLTTAARLLYGYAVSLENVGLVSPIKRTSILFATIVGGTLFHEKHLIKKSLACVIMLAGAFMIILSA